MSFVRKAGFLAALLLTLGLIAAQPAAATPRHPVEIGNPNIQHHPIDIGNALITALLHLFSK